MACPHNAPWCLWAPLELRQWHVSLQEKGSWEAHSSFNVTNTQCIHPQVRNLGGVHDSGCGKTLPKRNKVPAFCPKWCPFSSNFLSLPAGSIARGSRGRSWLALMWGSISLGPETSSCAGQRPLMLGKWTHCHLDFLHDSYFCCLRPHLQISSLWLWMHRVRHLNL